MSITIQPIKPENAKNLNTVDGTFDIDSRLRLSVEDDRISYAIVKTEKNKKRYRVNPIDEAAYINDQDKTAFLAYVDSQIAGQIILRENWNQTGYIEDIAVDAGFRRQGVGRELISWGVTWARERNLAGIMLETQDNNVGACLFYARCGFQLGGFDRNLYKGLDRDTQETALYWYLLF